MKKIFLILLSFIMIVIAGCGNNYQKQIDDLQAQVDELRSDLDRYTYDYKEDPDTLEIEINDENIEEYFDLVVVENSNGCYDVILHSLMYDKGYVLVGEYCSVIEWKQFNGLSQYSWPYGSSLDYPCVMYSDIYKIESAKSYAEKGVKNPALHITFLYDEAKLYYQKIEDIKYGYEIRDGVRVLNGEEYRDGNIYEKYPY